MSGVIGKFFFQFGVTMTVAVLLSLLEALTLTPMRASQFVAAGSRTTRIGRAADFTFRAVAALYRKWLAVALEHPWKVIGSSLAFFVLSFGTLNFINKEFIPVQDQSTFIVRMQTPIDSSMEFTDAKTREAEKFLAARPEIRRYLVAVGGFGTGGQSNLANIFVSMKPKGERGIDPQAGHELSQQELMAVTRQALRKLGLKASIQTCRSAASPPRVASRWSSRCRGVTGTSSSGNSRPSSRSSTPPASSPTPTATTCWASPRFRSSRIACAPPSAA